jgi:hypothetical protein
LDIEKGGERNPDEATVLLVFNLACYWIAE